MSGVDQCQDSRRIPLNSAARSNCNLEQMSVSAVASPRNQNALQSAAELQAHDRCDGLTDTLCRGLDFPVPEMGVA